MILSPIEQSIKRKIEAVGTPLKDWDIQINYGIKTGFNDAFIINTDKRNEILNNCADDAERARTDELIRPILRGRDIKRYGYDWADLWLIATFPSRHYDIDKYPAVKRHLQSFGMERLEQTGKEYTINGEKVKARKKTNNKWFETQDSISYWDVLIENETVWLNRQQMAILFDRDIKTIGKHIHNALSEELAGLSNSVVANFATTAADGKVYQTEHYNIEVITSIGYRVKSARGVQFRIWANKILKDYLLHGYAISKRFERLEYRVAKTEEAVDFFVKTALPPREGVFFDGQIFDAYRFVCDLVGSAKQRIILIDNYVDQTVLSLLDKRADGVSAQIYTQKPSALDLDLKRHNAQYAPIDVAEAQGVHDRFLIVDDVVYHIGASIKDLGKKLFRFAAPFLASAIQVQTESRN